VAIPQRSFQSCLGLSAWKVLVALVFVYFYVTSRHAWNLVGAAFFFAYGLYWLGKGIQALRKPPPKLDQTS